MEMGCPCLKITHGPSQMGICFTCYMDYIASVLLQRFSILPVLLLQHFS